MSIWVPPRMHSYGGGVGVTYFKLGVGWCSYDASTVLCLNPPNLQSADAALSSPFALEIVTKKNPPEDSVFYGNFVISMQMNQA